MDRLLIVLPTYNEAANIVPMTRALRLIVPTAHILIVDDCSPDGTGRIAQALSDADSAVSVIHRVAKAGLGSAYRAAFRWALDAGFDTIVQMDADGSHRPGDVPRLLQAIRHADVVIGSRWVRGGNVVHWPLRRILLSRGGSAYARLALGLRLRDVTGGFRVFRAHALVAMGATETTSEGYCFQVEMAMRAHDAGLVLVEAPISFVERTAGESKMSADIVREAVIDIARWAWQRRVSERLSGRRAAHRDAPRMLAPR